ncbi:hypothetical protein CP49_07100 [Bradyrhizobium valentinum]|uniref:Uncharacterized protein n=1 Tax=Bradyrhizobium valentinum TaxID=1518501 RepID=A0A0R3LJ40_9BRAD|nr:hypothetical protein CP49_07100 [Bradyrhizobium valentinum]
MVAVTVAATRAVMAGVGAMAGVMASMARPSLFARALAAIGIPTASASAGGDLGSIAVALDGTGDKIEAHRKSGAPFLFLTNLFLTDRAAR